MTGHLQSTLAARADALDHWHPDVDAIVRAADRRLRRRRTGAVGAGVAAAVVVTVAGLAGPTHDGPTVGRPPIMHVGPAHRSSDVVHTKFFDVPQPPSGFHVVGSLPGFAAITRDGTVDDLRRDTDSGLPQADITQILRVFYNAFAADSFERSQDPALGTPLRYDGRTFYLNSTWSPQVNYLQYQREDGTWLRLQYPKRYHFASEDMARYLNDVTVNPGAVPNQAGGAPQG